MIKYIQVNEITAGRFANDRAREMIKKYNDGNNKHLILKVYEPYQNSLLIDILAEGQFDYMSLADDKELVQMLEELSDNASPCYFDEEDVEVIDEDDMFPVPPMSEVKRAKSGYHRATTAPARVGSRTVRKSTMTFDFIDSKTGEVTTVSNVDKISLVTVREMLDLWKELGNDKVECNCYHNEPNSMAIEVALADGTYKYYDIKSTYDIYKM